MEEKPVKFITADPPSLGEYFVSLWKNRHILYALFVRDFKQQYVQTKLGFLWAVLKPAIITLLFTLLFSYLIKIKSDNYPYAIFALSGILGWNLFSTILNTGSNIVNNNISLVRKMSFPLLLLPLLSVANALTEWIVSFVLLIALMIFFLYLPPFTIVLVPLALIVNILLGLGVALWLNILSIQFRDLKQVVPYLVGFAIWVTPVFFPVTIVPENFMWVANLNPMTGILNIYRVLMFNELPDLAAMAWAVICSVVICFSGVVLFMRKESDMIDYL